jgi:hypothetical protein
MCKRLRFSEGEVLSQSQGGFEGSPYYSPDGLWWWVLQSPRPQGAEGSSSVVPTEAATPEASRYDIPNFWACGLGGSQLSTCLIKEFSLFRPATPHGALRS